MEKYYPPKHKEKQFHCIHCGVFAAQYWGPLYYNHRYSEFSLCEPLDHCVCSHCNQWSYWYEGHMVVPCEALVPPPHADMPAECITEYNEARSIVSLSPHAASALVRLAVQKLMVVLGEKGKNINDDIGSLVSKGLPVQVQQAMDFCRVVGNNAVHPGTIEINDTPEIAHNLFAMMNFIVEDRIARPRQVHELYTRLPEDARKAIEARDAKN
jgi:hypothetical protein